MRAFIINNTFIYYSRNCYCDWMLYNPLTNLNISNFDSTFVIGCIVIKTTVYDMLVSVLACIFDYELWPWPIKRFLFSNTRVSNTRMLQLPCVHLSGKYEQNTVSIQKEMQMSNSSDIISLKKYFK